MTNQPFDRLTRQTAAFLAAAGIPHDRLADHNSREWKIFIAGYECAERAAGTVRIPMIRASDKLDDSHAAAPAPAAPVAESQPGLSTLIGYIDPAELADFEESPADDAAVTLWHTEFPGAVQLFTAPGAPVPAASEGWTVNTGKQPVSNSTHVDVEFRNGTRTASQPADDWIWDHGSEDVEPEWEIVRWRPAAPATSDKAEG